MTTRRQFLQAGLVAASAVAFSRAKLFADAAGPSVSLAVQLWTFRQFDLHDRIVKTREAGIHQVEISGGISKVGEPGKRAVSMTADEKKQLRDVLAENRVHAISLGGSQGTPEDFDFAKEMGLQFLQGEPPVEKLVEVSRRAEEYNIRFSLHNHAKPTKYWDYRETLKRVQDCSPALGICPDTGHFIRSGFDPLEVIRAFKGRMVSVHLKDLNGTDQETTPKPKDVAWGTGKGQVEAILNELMTQKFTGPIIIEYDHIYPDGNVEDVKKCAEFFHKIVCR